MKFYFVNDHEGYEIYLPALHPLSEHFDDPNSVYCYSESDLIDFLNDIPDKGPI